MTRLSLDAVEMDPGSRYEARLRVRMATPETDVEEELRYAGQWSEWSRSARFPSPPRPDQGAAFPPGGTLYPSRPLTLLEPRPEAVLPQLATFPWRSGILKEGTHSCPASGFLEPVVTVSWGETVAPGGMPGLCFRLRSGTWSHLSREGWADPCDRLGRVLDSDDLADGGGGALRWLIPEQA